MSAFWFKPKTYGYGATPTTWEGWACVLIYVVLVAVAINVPGVREKTFADWLGSIAAIIVATALMIWISGKKTDGGLHWRWGQHQSRSQIDDFS